MSLVNEITSLSRELDATLLALTLSKIAIATIFPSRFITLTLARKLLLPKLYVPTYLLQRRLRIIDSSAGAKDSQRQL